MSKYQKNYSQEEIEIEVTPNIIKDLNIKKESIFYKGEKPYFKTTFQKLYKQYMSLTKDEAQAKRRYRENRCPVTGKNGKLIRCPESNKCKNCKYQFERKPFVTYADPEFLQNELCADELLEDKSVLNTTVEDFTAIVNKVNPRYGKIFQYMYIGAKPGEIAEYLMIDVQTIYKDMKTIRKILKPLAIERGFRPRR